MGRRGNQERWEEMDRTQLLSPSRFDAKVEKYGSEPHRQWAHALQFFSHFLATFYIEIPQKERFYVSYFLFVAPVLPRQSTFMACLGATRGMGV